MDFFKGRRGYLDGLSRIDQLSLLYLALPVAIFYLGWFKPLFGIVCFAVLVFIVFPRFKAHNETGPDKKSLATFCLVAFLTIIWCILGGAGHIFYANDDWVVRDAVLRDLVVYPWPVNYSTDPDFVFMLRAPIGYYLVPALIARGTGLVSADYLLLAWNIMGVMLFFSIIASLWAKRWHFFLAMGIFILFSGMDVVGTLFKNKPFFSTAFLEWWAYFFQYPSSTTVLYWAPNHGLPGWLAAALILKNWRDPRFLPVSLILTALIPLWSPLTALGTLFLFLAIFLFHLVRGTWKSILSPEAALACLIAVPVALFITLNTSKIPSGWIFHHFSLSNFMFRYVSFVAIELAVLPLVVAGEFRYKTGYEWLTTASFFFLLLIPLYYLGFANDFAMRASIPLLAVAAVRSAAVLIAAIERRSFAFAFIIFSVLAIGSVTPITETNRSLFGERWRPDLSHNLVQVIKSRAIHYYAQISRDDIPFFLKEPALFEPDK